MRGVQIWLQNPNQITFDPLFGQAKKGVKCWPGKKGGQMLSDLNFEARFGILSFFGIFRPPFVVILIFLFFDPLCIILFWFFCQAKKGVKCYPILILKPDLESSHFLVFFRHPFVMIFIFLFFGLLCIIDLRNNFFYRLKNQNFRKILLQRSFWRPMA